jgi:metacaspase-1
MKEFLLYKGFQEGDMVVLTDSPYVNPASPAFPTGQNMLRAFNWLISNSEGNSLFLHYSGHGGQVADPRTIVRDFANLS